jgi:hypothetical protein
VSNRFDHAERDKWSVTNDSETVSVVGRFQTQDGVGRLIAALEAQKALLPERCPRNPL